MGIRGVVALFVGAVVASFALRGPSVGAAASPAEQYWPQWRGPFMTGLAPHATPPVEWSETKNVGWKVEIPGKGSATPVVWRPRPGRAPSSSSTGAGRRS